MDKNEISIMENKIKKKINLVDFRLFILRKLFTYKLIVLFGGTTLI